MCYISQYVKRLALLSVLVAVGAKRLNINGPFTHYTEKFNALQRQAGTTKIFLPDVPMGPRIKYCDAAFLGVDSLKRTGDCWQEVERKVVHFDISYGFGLMAVVLPHLEVDGKNMSAFVRIRENSVHLSYTLHHSGDKCLTLNDLRIMTLGNVEFGASRRDYDGTNLDGLFKLVVVPTLNEVIESNLTNIEASLQALCQENYFEKNSSLQEHLMSLLLSF